MLKGPGHHISHNCKCTDGAHQLQRHVVTITRLLVYIVDKVDRRDPLRFSSLHSHNRLWHYTHRRRDRLIRRTWPLDPITYLPSTRRLFCDSSEALWGGWAKRGNAIRFDIYQRSVSSSATEKNDEFVSYEP